MPIIRTKHTTNYTITPNAVVTDSTLSAEARGVWAYLISKPPAWDFNAKAIKKEFNIGLNKIYRIMRELIHAGYAYYKRIQSAVIWFIFDTPQNIKTATAPAVINRVNFECVKNECVLERKEGLERKEKTTTQPPVTIMQSSAITPVVVFCENEKQPEAITPPDQVAVFSGEEEKQSDLNFPENLSVADLNAPETIKQPDQVVTDLIYPELSVDDLIECKGIAKRVIKPELTQEILWQLNDDIEEKRIKGTIPRYFRGLVNIANKNGIFKRTKAATDSKQKDYRQSHKPPEKVDNASFFADLQKRFGSKATAAIPAGIIQSIVKPNT